MLRPVVTACLLFALAAPAAAAKALPIKDGRLAPGVHRASVAQVVRAFGTGPGRAGYVPGLHALLAGMQRAGVKRAYLGGSFVRPEKARPGDVDLLFDESAAINGAALVRSAQAAFPAGIHVYPAGGRVDDVLGSKLTPAQRTAWAKAPPTYREFFQQNVHGPVGLIELDLTKPLRP